MQSEFPGINCCNLNFQNFNDFRDHTKEEHFATTTRYRCAQCYTENESNRGNLNSLKSLLPHCKKYHSDKLEFTSRVLNDQQVQDENQFDDDQEIYYDSNDLLDFDINNDDVVIEEMIIPNLINPASIIDFNQLNDEQRYCIELLRCKSEMSISFSALILISLTILTFLKDLSDKGRLNSEILEKLIDLSKSKFQLLNLAFEIGNAFHLFKCVPLQLADQAKTTIKAYVLNLKLALQKFLSVKEHVQQLYLFKNRSFDPNVIDSIKQTVDYYQGENECNLFMQIYIDDFDIKAGLNSSSKNTKICGIYLTFSNMPYQFQSKRKDHFLLGCIKSSDLHNLNDRNDFYKEIINQINEIYDHPFEFENDHICKAILWSIISDNLEANYLLNLALSFNSDSCKYCHIRKNELERTDNSCLRQIIEHAFSTCKAILNPILYAPDIFHDINEGIILKFFELIFKLNNENERIKMKDNYLKCKSFLKNGLLQINKGNLHGTGTQKLEFFIIFPFLATSETIYDRTLYKLLRSIIEFSYCDSIKKTNIPVFESKIKQFLELYRKSANDFNKNYPFEKSKHIKITFKLHHLHHYPMLIERFGPLKYSSTVRGERCHQLHKYALATSKSKVNVPHQIVNNWSIMYMMKEFNEPVLDKIIYSLGPFELDKLNDELKRLIQPYYDPTKELLSLKQMTIFNKTTKLNELYLYRRVHFNNLPSFIMINLIMKQNNGYVWVKGLLYEAIKFDQEKHSFVLKSKDEIIDYDASNPVNYRSFIYFNYNDGQLYCIKNINY